MPDQPKRYSKARLLTKITCVFSERLNVREPDAFELRISTSGKGERNVDIQVGRQGNYSTEYISKDKRGNEFVLWIEDRGEESSTGCTERYDEPSLGHVGSSLVSQDQDDSSSETASGRPRKNITTRAHGVSALLSEDRWLNSFTSMMKALVQLICVYCGLMGIGRELQGRRREQCVEDCDGGEANHEPSGQEKAQEFQGLSGQGIKRGFEEDGNDLLAQKKARLG